MYISPNNRVGSMWIVWGEWQGVLVGREDSVDLLMSY